MVKACNKAIYEYTAIAEGVRKYQVDQILALMKYQLINKVNEPEIKFALLGVRKGKLYENQVNSDMLLLLLRKAQTFDTMWKNII